MYMIERNCAAFHWMQQRYLQAGDPWELSPQQQEWLQEMVRQLQLEKARIEQGLEWMQAALEARMPGGQQGVGK